jgi:hypothetical protein
MTQSELAGWLPLASFALWWPVGAVPSLYRVWPAPLDEKLALIGGQRRAWQALNLFIAAAAVLLVLGFAALTDTLEQAGGGVLVRLSFATLLLGAGLWLASLVFRMTALTAAAGATPTAGFRAVPTWAGGLFLAWTALGNAAVARLRRRDRAERLPGHLGRLGGDRAGRAHTRPTPGHWRRAPRRLSPRAGPNRGRPAVRLIDGMRQARELGSRGAWGPTAAADVEAPAPG